jgi:predicted ATP-grasp superfamily ATP-dependent carboligase
MSFSVLIPDGDSEFALFAAHCLSHFPNVKIHALCEKRWSPIRFSRYCHSRILRQNLENDEERLDIIAEVVNKNGIDVLLPTETKGISFAIANREALSTFVAVVPLPDEKTFKIANNKWLLSRFLTQKGIPVPNTILITDDLCEQEIQDFEFPVLLKPTSAWGGEGFIRFENPSELSHYLEKQDLEKLRGQFIIQSFLVGFVVGFNILSIDGEIVATTMQRGIIPNSQKYAAAGAIEFIKDNRFSAICKNLVSAIGWSGFANVDALFDNQDHTIKILDFNARFWGSLRGSLLAGVSFPYLACLAALNIPFPVPDYGLVRYFHSKTALRESLFSLVGKSSGQSIALEQSGLSFLLADPIAEAVRAFQQEIL